MTPATMLDLQHESLIRDYLCNKAVKQPFAAWCLKVCLRLEEAIASIEFNCCFVRRVGRLGVRARGLREACHGTHVGEVKLEVRTAVTPRSARTTNHSNEIDLERWLAAAGSPVLRAGMNRSLLAAAKF